MRRLRQHQRRAATVVETAVVISLLVLFIFGIFDYGRFVMTRQLMENAAREGARYAVVNTYSATENDVKLQVEQKLGIAKNQLVGYQRSTNIKLYASTSDGTPIAGTEWTDTAFGQGIGVEVTGTFRPILPNLLFLDSSFTITSRSVMASEAN